MRPRLVDISPVFSGDPISLPVVENGGAVSGYRTRQAPCDGYLVETEDNSVFLNHEVVIAAVALMKVAKRRK